MLDEGTNDYPEWTIKLWEGWNQVVRLSDILGESPESPVEELGVAPDAIGGNLADFVKARQ
jgi:hypothetical protein